jgi:hypothetical protein
MGKPFCRLNLNRTRRQGIKVTAKGKGRLEMNYREPLPKTLPGVVCRQWVRCGRPNCRCARGGLHGPFYYRFWRVAGRLRKAYVRRTDLDRVRSQCLARQQFQRDITTSWEEWRQLVSLIREVEQR